MIYTERNRSRQTKTETHTHCETDGEIKKDSEKGIHRDRVTDRQRVYVCERQTGRKGETHRK